MRFFSNFHKKWGPIKNDDFKKNPGKSTFVREWWSWAAFGFCPELVGSSFYLTVTDPSCPGADLILQMYKYTRDKVGVSAAAQTGKWVGSFYFFQAWTKYNVGAKHERNYLACYQEFLIAASFNFSPVAWPNPRRRWIPGKPWILLRRPLSVAIGWMRTRGICSS